MNIQGADIEIVKSSKYLGVHLNNKLDWTDHSAALYKKGQSRLLLLCWGLLGQYSLADDRKRLIDW